MRVAAMFERSHCVLHCSLPVLLAQSHAQREPWKPTPGGESIGGPGPRNFYPLYIGKTPISQRNVYRLLLPSRPLIPSWVRRLLRPVGHWEGFGQAVEQWRALVLFSLYLHTRK